MITGGSVHAFYLFDVAQGIDLARVQSLVGGQPLPAIVPDKSPGTSRVRYLQPPVVAPGESLGAPSLDGFAVRVKFYDYGVISLRLSRAFTGTWGELAGVAQDLIENDALENHATALCQRIAGRVAPALTDARSAHLAEDYLALVVNRLDAPASAELVLERHGADIAQMLRGERQTLSNQEREEVLRHRLSYLTDDLVVPAYNAAFLYDTEAGAQPSLEILEYVNSQLLEYRYHDELLETELGRIYGALQQPRSFGWLFGRRSARAVKELHSLFIDINELNDRMENVLKLVGDVYAARLFGLAGARLGLDAWKHNVEEKLETLDDIYRFTVEQGSMSRANLLELIIVLILTVEFGFFLRDLLR
jgi:hypothetical protein